VTALQGALRTGVFWLSVVATPTSGSIAQEATSGTVSIPPNVPPCPAGLPIGQPGHMISPKYPKEALASGVEGPVELSAVVGPDARTRELRVVSGNPILATSALNADRQWRFRPALVKGEPVETR